MITRKEGLVFVVSAPSGAGKTTLCKAITDSLGNLRHSISYTTRRARPGEKDGRDYFFVPEEKFRAMVRAGDFAEWAEVHSHLYGTSRQALDDLVANGIDVILDIDTQGAQQIKKTYKKAMFLFILPPSLAILEERLHNRRSDDPEEIKKRMQRAREEIREYAMYDYIIVNRDFDRALDELRSIIIAERCRTRMVDPQWMEGLF
ncbi:MAG TPA: guanylate kinase [Nitrospirota bacterium]|nr:guanylate kinase [Nitrospirota bacterium]